MPEKDEKDKSKALPRSRLEQLRRDKQDDDYEPEMPPLDRAAYLVRYLFEIGPVQAAGMGSAPVSHGEIESWMHLTRVQLQPWEARLIRRLSLAFVNESGKAQRRDCASPWQAADLKPVVSGAQAAVRALAQL